MSTYEAAGVSIEAGDRAVELMKASIAKAQRPEVFGGIGGFAGLFDASALKGFAQPLLATSTDGVGTKTEIARQMGKYDTIGEDLVAMVVDDLVVCGAEPLFMTDYIAVGKVFPDQKIIVFDDEEIVAASSKPVTITPKPTETIYSYNTTEESAGEYWRKEWARANPPVKSPVDKPKQNNKIIVRRDCLFCEDKSGTYAEAKKWEGKNSRNKQDRKELTMLFNESTIPPIDPGKLPWCAAFANSILNKLGLEGTNSLMARSFLHYGAPTKNPQVGDIVVTKRGRGNVAGHVGFFEGYEVVDGITYVKIFGGNTDKMVSTGWFPVTAVLGFRKIPQYS